MINIFFTFVLAVWVLFGIHYWAKYMKLKESYNQLKVEEENIRDAYVHMILSMWSVMELCEEHDAKEVVDSDAFYQMIELTGYESKEDEPLDSDDVFDDGV